MELSDFITEALTQISSGIKRANQQISEASGNTEGTPVFMLRPGSQQERGAGVDFNVAITTVKGGGGKGAAKVKVAVFEAEISGDGGGQKENVSRVRFTVTVNNWHG